MAFPWVGNKPKEPQEPQASHLCSIPPLPPPDPAPTWLGYGWRKLDPVCRGHPVVSPIPGSTPGSPTQCIDWEELENPGSGSADFCWGEKKKRKGDGLAGSRCASCCKKLQEIPGGLKELFCTNFQIALLHSGLFPFHAGSRCHPSVSVGIASPATHRGPGDVSCGFQSYDHLKLCLDENSSFH